MNSSRHKGRRRPFALAEVCVAIAIVSLAVSCIFYSLSQSVSRCTVLQDEIRCNELAEEYLAKGVAQFLTNPPEFDAVAGEKGALTSAEVGVYTVTVQTSCEREEKKEEASTSGKDPVALVELTVVVQKGQDKERAACRSVLLCLCKGGS